MKKTLIALAAVAATSVFAQSSVTLTGGMQAGFYKAATVGAENKVDSDQASANNIAFTAKTALGSGLTATFYGQMRPQMEDGLTGSYNSPFEQMKTSIAGGFGEVAFGRFTRFAGGMNGGIGRVFGDDGGMGNYGSSANTRVSGQFQYTSPAFNGFQIGFSAVPGLGAATQSDMGLKYSAGKLTAGIAQTTNSGGTDGTDQTEFGVKYDFGMVRVGVAQNTLKATGAANVKETGWNVEVPMGATTLGLGYGDKEGAKKTALQARYALSKSTTLAAKYLNSKTAAGVSANGSFVGFYYTF